MPGPHNHPPSSSHNSASQKARYGLFLAQLPESGMAMADRVERVRRKRNKEGPAGVAVGYVEDA